jgi:hypothetical protein
VVIVRNFGLPLEGATVEFRGTSATTDEYGEARFNVSDVSKTETYDFTIDKAWFNGHSGNVTVYIQTGGNTQSVIQSRHI